MTDQSTSRPSLAEIAAESTPLMTDVPGEQPLGDDVPAPRADIKKPSLAVIANALGHGGSSGY